jgi:hypothetical protein
VKYFDWPVQIPTEKKERKKICMQGERERDRVAILKYEKIAKFASENSQNSHLIFKNSHKLATFYTHFAM